MGLNILIVDDEINQRELLAGFLSKKKFNVNTAGNGKEACNKIDRSSPDLILCDYKMPDISGIEVLRYAKNKNPETAVIIITAFGNIENAVESIREGAYNYIQKPIDLEELLFQIDKIKERKHLVSENKVLKERLSEKFRFSEIVTVSSEMEEALNIAGRVSGSKTTVLLRGESGTGKELFAKAIHYSSDRKNNSLITINCASFSETLLESELFGHEKGAFTGADRQRIGKLEQADKGTLFIDEVGDIPLTTQIKLLRFLQFNEIERVGGNTKINIDVRIIGATNRNLEELIIAGNFRKDFYYRINVVTINIPPLRDRKKDIPLLADHFIKKYSVINNKSGLSLSKEAMDALVKYNYPGNIRELENIIERCVVLSREEFITTNELPINLKTTQSEGITKNDLMENESLEERLEKIEKEFVLKALQAHNQNQSKAAEALGIPERNIRYRLKKWGIK
jgi:two-component system NtrC family response regulator